MWPLTVGETWSANIPDRHPAAAVRSNPMLLLRSCKTSEARSSTQGFPLRRSVCSIPTVFQFEVANNL
jgi:hypothetical protein